MWWNEGPDWDNNQIWILLLPLTGYVMLVKSLSFSEPHFLLWKIGGICFSGLTWSPVWQGCERLLKTSENIHESCLMWFKTRLWEQKWPYWLHTSLELLTPGKDTSSSHCWTPGTWNQLLTPSASAGTAWEGNKKGQLACSGCFP